MKTSTRSPFAPVTVLLAAAATATAGALRADAAPPEARAACAYQDLMPDFRDFRAETKQQPPATRALSFAKEFAARHPEYYARSVFGDEREIAEGALRLFDSAQWPAIAGYQPLSEERILEVGSAAGGEFARAQETFLREFPDFRCDTFVAFGPSLFSFDGRTYRGADGRARLLFGVEMIALFHTTEDLAAFFQHELFHLYQSQVHGAREPADKVIWWALWSEGLATFVSHQLNPTLKPEQVFWYPRDLDQLVERELPQHAGALLGQFDEDADEVYGLWFEARSRKSGPPPRAGYYLGYLLARELARQRSLDELARLEPKVVREQGRRFLRSLAAGEVSRAP